MASRKLIVEVVVDTDQVGPGFQRASNHAKTFNRDLTSSVRGAVAGTGVFKSLGRSLAFASGGFIAFAGLTDLLRKSVDAARDAGVAQKQLARQLKNNGETFATYREQIDKTTLHLSGLAGFTKTELEQSLTTILRTVPNVSQALKDNALAADIARARHISLAQAALVVAKTEAGNTTLLRRQGFQIAKNATAEQALAKVRRVVAGQAIAGTTAAERFNAVFHDTEVAIGTGILPIFNKYLIALTKWLQKNNESGKTQREVNRTAKTGNNLLRETTDLYKKLTPLINATVDAFNSLQGPSPDQSPVKKFLDFLSFGTLTPGGGGPTGRLSQGSRNAEDAAKAAAGEARIAAAVADASTQKQREKAVFSKLQNTIFDNAIARILLRGGLGNISAQIGALQKADGLLAQRIKATKDVTRKLRLEDDLLQNQAQISALNAQQTADAQQAAADALQKQQDAAQKLRDRIVAQQFRALGLSATGDTLTPGKANLLKQVTSLSARLLGAGADTPKIKHELKRIHDVLVGTIPPKIEVRQKIAEMLQAIRDGLQQATKAGNLTKFAHASTAALLAGLGLDPKTKRILEQRLAQIGAGGTVPGARSVAFAAAGTVVTHTVLQVDGKTIADVVTPHQQKAQMRRSVSRRGPYAGRH